jgi:hypothetical protein
VVSTGVSRMNYNHAAAKLETPTFRLERKAARN